MQNTPFVNKNVLLLLPIENQVFNFLCGNLKKYFNNIHKLNFVEYCYQYGIKNTEKYIKNLIYEKKIDILISSPFAGRFELFVEFYASLRDKIKIVFWMFDDEMYFDSYSKYYCQIANCVITTDYFAVFNYEKFGIPAIFFFSTFSKNNYYPVEIEKDIDVSFLGDCNKNDRMEYINFLINNGIKVETFGRGSKNGFIEWDRFSEIFSRSKINLHFTKLDELNWINKDEPLLNKVRGNKGRPIEIALTKSFCLSEYTPFFEITFEIGKEIDVFYTKEELLEKIGYYILNDNKREEIAKNAYKKAIENYEAGVCIPKLLNELGEILAKNNKQKKPEIFLSKPFKIKFVTGLIISMLKITRHGKIKPSIEIFRELFKYGIFVFFAGFYGSLIRLTEKMASRK